EGEDSARPHRCGNSFLSLGGQPGGPGLPGHHGPRAGAESRVLLSDCCAGRPAGGAGRGVGTGHRAGLGRCSGPQRRQGRAPAPVTVAVFCPFTQVGKRRGGNKLALKTGIVAKKQKTEDEVLTSKGDAWAKYMAEVKKYKAHQCGDDDKTRPLVK
ncbi:hypothetical protein E2I00_001634, partial [Balaenoptera physalus]